MEMGHVVLNSLANNTSLGARVMRVGIFVGVCMFLALGACSKSAVEEQTVVNDVDDAPGLIESKVAESLVKAKAVSHLNAFITLDEEGALARAKELDQLSPQAQQELPLLGLTMVAKDNIHVAGLPNTAGTPGLKNFVPKEDNPVVARLEQAGVVFLGKTNLHELAYGITSNNAAFGAVANPVNTETFAGGSSGGTAAAVAANVVTIGLGTDTGGSVRIPSALTGIVGFRPSTDRYPKGAVTPISHTRDTVGLMGQSVAQVAQLDAIVTEASDDLEQIQPSSLRLGVPRQAFYANMDPEAATVVDDALGKLTAAGVTLVEVEIPRMGELLQASSFNIALYETVIDLTAYLEEHYPTASFADVAAQTASPDVHGLFGMLMNSPPPKEVYDEALVARQTLRDICKAYFAENQLDGIVFPTTILPARPIEGSDETVSLNGADVPTFPTYIRNTDLGSIAALPGISIPAGKTSSGLPIGMEIDGPEMSDRRVLAIALVVEQLLQQ